MSHCEPISTIKNQEILYLTAFPDDYYFCWQLEIQLDNFKQLGIPPSNIHVIISFDVKRGLQNYFADLIENLRERAMFYTYPDYCDKQGYLPAIRPFLVAQHFRAHPELEQQAVFYYDTDIIFRELPDFNTLLQDEFWYVSDTRNYLDSSYIKRVGGEGLLYEMCQVVGINPLIVERGDINCGGAQYVIKKSTCAFWEKVENDCKRLYNVMQLFNAREAEANYIANKKKRSEYHGIQAWCADMWAVLWNAWLFAYTVRTHEEMDFCWPTNNISEWQRLKILHYSGNVDKGDKHYFRKVSYIKFAPYHDITLKEIKEDSCSFPLSQLIMDYKGELDKRRIDLSDMSFLFSIRVDSESRLANLYYVITYLAKHFKTNILIHESDTEQKVNPSLLPDNCIYNFSYDSNPLFAHTKVNNSLIRKSETQFIAIHDADVVIPIDQIIASVNVLRKRSCDMIYPYDGSFVSVDSLAKEMFGKMLDSALFELNKNKFVKGMERSYGGAVFIDRQTYTKAGLDNEYISSWGPEDIERQKRMKNLGYSVKRTVGNIYHLPHDRFENSFYKSTDHRIQLMDEYLKICRMKKQTLEAYIKKWSWIKN